MGLEAKHGEDIFVKVKRMTHEEDALNRHCHDGSWIPLIQRCCWRRVENRIVCAGTAFMHEA